MRSVSSRSGRTPPSFASATICPTSVASLSRSSATETFEVEDIRTGRLKCCPNFVERLTKRGASPVLRCFAPQTRRSVDRAFVRRHQTVQDSQGGPSTSGWRGRDSCRQKTRQLFQTVSAAILCDPNPLGRFAPQRTCLLAMTLLWFAEERILAALEDRATAAASRPARVFRPTSVSLVQACPAHRSRTLTVPQLARLAEPLRQAS